MAKNNPPPKSFEDAMKELEQILTDMESGNVGLEESLARYERGTFLIQHCRSVLAAAEKQIQEITRKEDGSLVTEPIPDSPESKA